MQLSTTDEANTEANFLGTRRTVAARLPKSRLSRVCRLFASETVVTRMTLADYAGLNNQLGRRLQKVTIFGDGFC
jgi:hypothetical protein